MLFTGQNRQCRVGAAQSWPKIRSPHDPASASCAVRACVQLDLADLGQDAVSIRVKQESQVVDMTTDFLAGVGVGNHQAAFCDIKTRGHALDIGVAGQSLVNALKRFVRL